LEGSEGQKKGGTTFDPDAGGGSEKTHNEGGKILERGQPEGGRHSTKTIKIVKDQPLTIAGEGDGFHKLDPGGTDGTNRYECLMKGKVYEQGLGKIPSPP